jgi:hypothetical protein
MVSTEDDGMNAIMNSVATAPSANAIGIPANITHASASSAQDFHAK